MGKLTDMLPEIEAEIRAYDHVDAIVSFLGCKILGCSLTLIDESWDHAVTVRHNEQQRRFDQILGRHRHDGMIVVPRPRTGEPMPLMPFAMAEWIEEQHAEILAQCEAERQAATDADGWRSHAAMVSLDAY